MSNPPFPLTDKVPPEQEECHSCHYATRHLHKVDPDRLSGQKRYIWLCDLCYSTLAGNAVQYPEQYRESGQLMRHMCYLANVLLDQLKQR